MITFEEAMFEVCFTHVDNNTNVITTIAVERLEKWLKSVRAPCKTRLQATEQMAAHCVEKCNPEQHRLDRITEQVIRHNPIIVGEWEDGTHTIFDGNHRLIQAVRKFNRDWVPAYIVPPEAWRHFVVTDFPVELLDADRMREALSRCSSGIV